jgi:hypothetical protein
MQYGPFYDLSTAGTFTQLKSEVFTGVRYKLTQNGVGRRVQNAEDRQNPKEVYDGKSKG